MRILFVDDESRVLDGLRRSLFKQRGLWTMSFALSGAEALDLMAANPFDVIVSDMRMPQMDGATLLEQVRERHPQVVRIVLSGHAELDQAMRAMTVAHQYLSKPCDGAALVSAIEQATVIRRMLDCERLRELVTRIGSLPPAPMTYTRMMKLMSDDHSAIADFVRLLEADPALTAKLLQVANSAYFAGEGRVQEPAAAASRIGLRALRSLTLFVESTGQFGAGEAAQAIGREVAERGQQAALLAGRFCESAAERETATTAALLHEVGRLALAARLPEEYGAILATCTATGRPLHDVEREGLGADHAAVGGFLFSLWRLPIEVVEAIAQHHQPGALPEPLGASGAVRLAAAWAGGAMPEEWREDRRWGQWQAEAADALESGEAA